MCDYHVFSTEDVMNGTVTDHGVVLKVSDVPWAGRQLWDCAVACKNGNYFLMSAEGGTAGWHSEVIFRGDSPTGKFLSLIHIFCWRPQ